MSAELTVDRGANATRVGALVLILSTAQSVGIGVGIDSASLLCGVVWGLFAAVAAAILVLAVYRIRPVRRLAMEAMYWLTGE